MTRCESYPLCSGTIYFPTAPFLGQLLLRSMDRAVALYESMELRGFHGEFYYAEKVYNKLVSWGYVIFWVSVFILMRTCSVTVLLGRMFV